ncbi:MAG: hypothetical protein VZS44_06775 [Bacilli bacterium]|nr:hypothetical protein [Bacilli bacterium]
MNRKSKDTFNAKVDIVMYPDTIKNYSQDRDDYIELAMTAIKQKPSVIKYISPSYKEYQLLCEEAIEENAISFSSIDESVSNYKELGIRAIKKNPYIVLCIDNRTKDYIFFWELAISQCLDILKEIDKNDKELFPLLKKTVEQNPLAIYYIDSRITIYNELCELAYNKNKDLIEYMDINSINKELVFEALRINPERIKYLDNTKNFYIEACKLVLSIDGTYIKDIYLENLNDNLNQFFELVEIAEKTNQEVFNNANVLNALRIENRQMKDRILSTPNFLGNNLYKLLQDLDNEYDDLSKKIFNIEIEEYRNSKSKTKRL